MIRPFSHTATWLAFALALGSGCGGEKAPAEEVDDTAADTDPGECDRALDTDCDGAPNDVDCLPEDPWSYPGADDIPYDGIDNDCAGDGDLTDVDGDGYDGEAGGGDDCNDGNPEVYPGAPEDCDDTTIDENCDGVVQLDDCDNDGYPETGKGELDCDDDDPTINPGAEETWYDGVDQDCSGPYSSDYDADGDGEDSDEYEGEDCDDTDPETNPSADERWDGIDRDCDGTLDRMTTYDAYQAYYANYKSGDFFFGKCFVELDDYDGDGTVEMGVCGPFSGASKSQKGWFQVLKGDGTEGTPPDVAVATIVGESGSWLAYDADRMGDLNGDGLTEVAVGAPLWSGSVSGAALVYDGADLQAGGTVSGSDYLASAVGSADYVGLDLAVVPDVDGDGVSDLVGGTSDWYLGMPSGVAISAFVWSGALLAAGGDLGSADALASMTGSTTGGEIVGGDFDGDGLSDVIVATSSAASGGVTVVPGADLTGGAAISVSSLERLTGSGPDDALGAHNAVLRDADGDGLADLAASAPGQTTSVSMGGEVYVISAPDLFAEADAVDVAFLTIEGVEAYGRLVASGERGGDFDLDGVEDIVVAHIGGSEYGSISGTVYAISGVDVAAGGTLSADEHFGEFPSRMDDDLYGWGGLAFDIDGDGDDDLALGAPANNTVGMAQVFLAELSSAR